MIHRRRNDCTSDFRQTKCRKIKRCECGHKSKYVACIGPKGTTTDPVEKTMELLPLGPVVIIDTAGFDDGGTLGTMRVELTKAVLNRVDIAVLVVDGTIGMTSVENELVSLFEEKKIPYLIVFNKCDLLDNTTDGKIFVSAKTIRISNF